MWLHLHAPLHRGQISSRRGPDEHRILDVVQAGAQRIATADLELAVLDLLDVFGPRSTLDLSVDLAVGREIHDVLTTLTFGSWVNSYDRETPDQDLAITERGQRRLTAAFERGSYESDWR